MNIERCKQYVRTLNNDRFKALLRLLDASFPLDYNIVIYIKYVKAFEKFLFDDILIIKTQFLENGEYERAVYLTEWGNYLVEYLKDCREKKLKT